VPIKHSLTPQEFDKELSAAGWTFFFMAGTIRMTAFGFNRHRTVDAALNRCIKAARQQRCNCLQIESVEMRSFLGVPYVRVSARLRHIQKGLLFGELPVAKGTHVIAHKLHPNVVAT
jgi:hypothetical protein